jgi:hypothetical protein
MGFKLKSGNKVDFKNMGSSPVKNMKDGDYSQSFEKPGPPQTEDGKEWKMPKLESYKMPVMETGLIQAKKEEQDAVNDAAEGKAVDKDAEGNVKTEENTGGSAGAELKTTSDKYEEGGDLKEGDKKWHETDAFRNTGVGHITDAVKSIGRGIKNIRTKNKAKKAEKLTSAKEAIESDTQTLKQQKLVDKTNKKQRKKAVKDIRKSEEDRIKLVKYNKRKKKNA